MTAEGKSLTVNCSAIMRVRLLLFAVLRDIVGSDEQQLDVAPGTSAQDIWSALRDRHSRLHGYVKPPMTAVNLEYVAPETILRDGDELAFIPPVSGG